MMGSHTGTGGHCISVNKQVQVGTILLLGIFGGDI